MTEKKSMTESTTRESKMIEEEKLFQMINACCKKILQLMATDTTVKYLATKKCQIVPNNYPEIIARCREVLPQDKLEVVNKCKKTIDTCIGMVVERYMEWGLVTGEKIGRQFGVDPIESKSSAVLGLYRAAFTYKPGNGFANYAPFWITQIIQKSIDERMINSLDNVLGDDENGETAKDRVPSDIRFEPSTIIEDRQLSDVFRHLVNQLPVHERQEVINWWEMDSAVTPAVQSFARKMSAAI